MRRVSILFAIALVASLWVMALVAAPGWADEGSSSSGRTRLQLAAAAVYAAGALVCHQRPERSFHIDGTKLPVCARCFGLYAGGAIGVLLWAGLAARRRSSRGGWVSSARVRRWLAIAAAPTIATVVTAWLGWWDPPNLLRAVLAVPLGIAIAATVAAVAAGDLE